MKTREGFVSNSSTASFLIYGTSVPCNDWYDVDPGWKELRALGLSENRDEEGSEIFVGASWCGVKDDETGRQFKDRIEAAIRKFLPDAKEFGTHEGAYYNG